MLLDGEEDLRTLPFAERRKRLEAFVARAELAAASISRRCSRSPAGRSLRELRAHPPEGDPQIAEGLMLKRWDSIYEAGRPKGPWFKWKRDPHLVDAVLMYAQRGHGKRSGFYSDYTFGVWKEDANGDRALTPVGKAYFGFTDEELKQLDKFVRDNTVERFGPVRAVKADKDFGLVLEVAFEGLQRSTRHKSGVAMRFPAHQPHPLGQAGARSRRTFHPGTLAGKGTLRHRKHSPSCACSSSICGRRRRAR